MDLDISDGAARANHALLHRLLDERNRDPARAEAIDAEIRRAFEQTVAILVLDMVGFSRTSLRLGIIHYLAMIRAMEAAARPAVAAFGGRVIKQEADNLFAVFDTPTLAVRAALAIFEAFEASNREVEADRHIQGGIGIGFGPVLVIDGRDLFGSEMNLACKLGEDHAQGSEILLTAAACSALEPDLGAIEPATFAVSGLRIDGHRLRYDRAAP